MRCLGLRKKAAFVTIQRIESQFNTIRSQFRKVM